MKSPVDVVAAIPSYNHAEGLDKLLPQVLEQDYSAVFVMDDASTDETPDILAKYAESVKPVLGKENVGAAANRNRILKYDLGKSALHFMDADQQLVSQRTPELVLDALDYERRGAVCGLITDSDGNMWPGNFVPPISISYYLAGGIEAGLIYPLVRRGKLSAARAVRETFYPMLRNFPDLANEPVPRKVFSAVEGNMAIRADQFRAVGGYDPKLRYHESQDLAYKLSRSGLDNWFEPSIKTEHPGEFSISGKELEVAKATVYLIKKYGLFRFLLAV